MKELTAVFQDEIFHAVVCLVVPGFYAMSTVSIVGWQRIPGLPQLVDGHPGTTGIIMLLAFVTCGLIMEEFGSRIEILLDSWLAKVPGHEQHLTEWFDYLRLAFKVEPVGQHYLRTLVLRLKFELGMAVASLPCAFGAVWLEFRSFWRFAIVVFAVITCVYFFLEAKSSVKTLSELRHEMLKKDWSEPSGATAASGK
jgi:hypothetical protein